MTADTPAPATPAQIRDEIIKLTVEYHNNRPLTNTGQQRVVGQVQGLLWVLGYRDALSVRHYLREVRESLGYE